MAFVLSLAFFADERLKDGELPEDNSSSAVVSTSLGIIGSLPLLRALDAQLDRYLVHLFQDSGFFLFEPLTGHSHAASVQHDLATPSFVFLVPPIFSPALEANGGINLLAIGSSDCLTLRPPWMNQV